VIPPAIFFYYSTLFDSRFKTLQQNQSNTIKIILDIKALFVNVVIPIVITIKFVIIILSQVQTPV
ncbi:hypothetical protein LC896_12700, partial [Enterococcus faecium]|nr:hypothetical protein [Enterococcus faecium]